MLADSYDGKRFNGTNDVVVKKDGAIYLADMFGSLRLGEDANSRHTPQHLRERLDTAMVANANRAACSFPSAARCKG